MAPKKRTGKTLLDQVNRNHVASVKLVRDCCQRQRSSHTEQCNGFEREGVRKGKLKKKKEIWMRAIRRANQAYARSVTDRIGPTGQKHIETRDLLLQCGQDMLRDILQVADNMLALAESRARDFNTAYASRVRVTAYLQHDRHTLLQMKSANGKTSVVPALSPFVSNGVVGLRAHPLIVLGKKTAIPAYAGGTSSCWIHGDLAHGNDALPSLLEVRSTI